MNDTRPPQCVVFDFYGTLAETPDWGPSWEDLVAELGYTLPPEVRDRWWHDGIDGTEHDEHSVSRDHYVAWQQARMRQMLRECGVPDTAHARFLERVRELSGHHRITAFDDVVATLDTLRADGVRLAICSNWDWDLAEAVETAGLTGAVDLMFSSAWIGARKPHPRVYAHVLAELSVDPEDVVFVGDTWSCDVEGPLAAGMRAVYVRRVHHGADLTAPAGAPEVDGLTRAADLSVLLDLVARSP